MNEQIFVASNVATKYQAILHSFIHTHMYLALQREF